MDIPSVEFMRTLAVDDALLERLRAMPFTATGTRRICFHESESSPLHAMLVESEAGSSFPAHCHTDSDEVTILMKGLLEILVWERGIVNLPTRVLLGRGEGEAYATFVAKYTPHVTRPLGDNCVYLEVKIGPFSRDSLVPIDRASLKFPN